MPKELNSRSKARISTCLIGVLLMVFVSLSYAVEMEFTESDVAATHHLHHADPEAIAEMPADQSGISIDPGCWAHCVALTAAVPMQEHPVTAISQPDGDFPASEQATPIRLMESHWRPPSLFF